MPQNESMSNENHPPAIGSEVRKLLGSAALEEGDIFGIDSPRPQNYDPQGKYSLGVKVLEMLEAELEQGAEFGYDVADEGNEFAELEYGNTKLPPSTISELQPTENIRRAQLLGERVLTAA